MHPAGKARSPNRRTRARAAIAWGIVLFSAAQLGLNVGIAFWWPQFRDPEFGRRLKVFLPRLAATSPKPLTVVMVGSSRTMQAFNATRFEQELSKALGQPVVAFNFGITGAGPLTELLSVRRLLARGVHPDLVLIEIMPALLGAELGGSEAGRLAPQQLSLRDLRVVRRYLAGVDGMRREWWSIRSWPCYTYRFQIVSQTCPFLLPYESRMDWILRLDASGWVELQPKKPSAESRHRQTERARQEYEAALKRFQLGDIPTQELRDLLELCRHERIAAALVLMPEGPLFRSWYPPQAWSQIECYVRALERDYGMPVINARDWIAEDDFADSHHLLSTGATRFVDRLIRVTVPLMDDRLLAARNRSASRAGNRGALRQGPASDHRVALIEQVP